MKLPVRRTETLFVRVSPEVKSRLAAAAIAHHVSISAFLEGLLHEFFSDAELSGLDEEAELRAEVEADCAAAEERILGSEPD